MKPPLPTCMEPCPQNRYLVNQVMGFGRLQKHGYRYPLQIDALPYGFQPPFRLHDVQVLGPVQARPVLCGCGPGCAVEVEVPLLLCLTDCNERCFTASAFLQEKVQLHLQCHPREIWRHTLNAHAAVRLNSPCCFCCAGECAAILDVFIEVYLVNPCMTGPSCPQPCPENRPWYPSPICRN